MVFAPPSLPPFPGDRNPEGEGELIAKRLKRKVPPNSMGFTPSSFPGDKNPEGEGN
jgi:hypothetical protein